MNKLKFRAWDGQKMVSPDYITREGIAYWYEDGVLCSSEIIMQWNGLKDCDANDYYFDDIIETNQGVGVLVWFDDRLGIASGSINDYHAIDEISKYELTKSKKIGNIYENKEL